MLFPTEEAAQKVWLQVVEAVIANKLGTAAKIASSGPTRLICIYTKDFSDIADVKRVLEAMVTAGFTSKDAARPIYYKCDAFTYLDIGSGNEYGIPASLYNSKDILNDPTPRSTAKQAASDATKKAIKPLLKQTTFQSLQRVPAQPSRRKRTVDGALPTVKEPAKKKTRAK
jgi:hypothetical protein